MSTETLMAPDVAPRPAAARFQSVSIVHPAELVAFEDQWQSLGKLTPSPIEQFAWSASCVAELLDQHRLQVIALRRGGHCEAIAPLYLSRIRGIARARMLGVGELGEPMDLLAANSQSRADLARSMVHAGRPLWLERLPADSPTVVALEQACRGRAICVRRPQASCPVISLDGSWLEPEQHLNSGRRSDLRRARRKVEQQGALKTEILTPRADELDSLLNTAFEIEARSWKGESGTALACDDRRAAFFRRYARAACREGILRLCFLRIGERPVAMQIAVECGDGFWLLKVGYDAEFGSCSPGLLLMRDTIAYAARAGLKTYEFLGKAEAWTEVWTKQERACVSLRIYPYGWRGLTALALDAAEAYLSRRRKPCTP